MLLTENMDKTSSLTFVDAVAVFYCLLFVCLLFFVFVLCLQLIKQEHYQDFFKQGVDETIY